MKRALQVAKKRGKKLGTHNNKVKGKGAKARKKAVQGQAMKLARIIRKQSRLGHGAKVTQKCLNEDRKAVELNRGKYYHLSKVQRLISYVNEMKKL